MISHVYKDVCSLLHLGKIKQDRDKTEVRGWIIFILYSNSWLGDRKKTKNRQRQRHRERNIKIQTHRKEAETD